MLFDHAESLAQLFLEQPKRKVKLQYLKKLNVGKSCIAKKLHQRYQNTTSGTSSPTSLWSDILMATFDWQHMTSY